MMFGGDVEQRRRVCGQLVWVVQGVCRGTHSELIEQPGQARQCRVHFEWVEAEHFHSGGGRAGDRLVQHRECRVLRAQIETRSGDPEDGWLMSVGVEHREEGMRMDAGDHP